MLPPDLSPSAPDAAAAEYVAALAEGIERMLSLAEAMVAAGRSLDLSGLDQAVGLLCAKALDLPPEEASRIRPQLIASLRALDRLSASLRENASA